MKRQAFIDWLRAKRAFRAAPKGTYDLLADAVEEADASFTWMVKMFPHADGWHNTAAEGYVTPVRAISYLTRRGLIERKPGAEHLVRFTEEEAKL